MQTPLSPLDPLVRFVARGRMSLQGERTFELVRDMVDVERVGPLTVKGFQRPITAYNVLGMKGVRRADETVTT